MSELKADLTVLQTEEKTSPEGLEEPNVTFLFAGWRHEAFNVQGARRIGSLLSGLDQKVTGEGLIFLEAYGMDFAQEQSSRKNFERFGSKWMSVFASLSDELGRDAYIEEVDERLLKINSHSNIFGAVKDGLIPLKDMSNFVIYDVIDDLRKRVNLKIKFERQHQIVYEALPVDNDQKEQMLAAETRRGWLFRDLDAALRADFETTKYVAELVARRNPQMLKDIKTAINKFKKNKDQAGAAVYIGGRNHYPLVCDLRDKMGGEKAGIRFVLEPEKGWNSPSVQLLELVLQNVPEDEIPVELRAQALLEHYMQLELQGTTETSDNLQMYCEHYEDVEFAINNIAANTSLDEIRGLCGRISLEDFIKQHPLAQDVVDFLPF